MAKTPKPAPETVVPAPSLPASGGAWLRLADGSLIPDPSEPPPEGAADPVETLLKDV